MTEQITFQPTPLNADQSGQFFYINQFGGMNTISPRFAIGDGKFSYLENLLPLSSVAVNPVSTEEQYASALTVVPPQGANLPALPVVQVVDRMWHLAVGPGAGVSPTNWLIVHTQQGNLYAYDIDKTPVANPVKINGSVLFGLPDMVVWQGTQLLVVDRGAGYYSFTCTGASNALTWSAGVSLSAPASNLSLIAIAFGRVCVLANTQTYIFSAPGSYTDFTVLNGGISVVITSEALRKSVTKMQLCGDYLYFIGDGAVFVAYNMQASGAHQLSEVERTHGTQFYGAVENVEGTLVIATSDNLYSIQGSAPTVLMPAMSTFWAQQLDLLSQQLVVTVATIRGAQVSLVLAKYVDPASGPRSIFLALCHGNALILSQATNIVYTCTVEMVEPDDGRSMFVTYATDGTNIYPCFRDDPDTVNYSGTPGVTFKAVTKLYDMNQPAFFKQFVKGGAVGYCTSPFGTLTLQMDTEAKSSSTSLFSLPGLTFTNSSGAVITFTNTTLQAINFVVSGIVMMRYTADLQGRYVGFTLSGTTPGFSLAALAVEFQPGASWLGGGA